MTSIQKMKQLHVLLGLTASLAILRLIYSKLKKSKSSRKKGSPSTTEVSEEEQAKALALLKPTFAQASLEAKSLTGLSQLDQLMLYGLYKQAHIGDINIDEPNRMNVVAWKKHEAWSKFDGMPRHFAMMKYIEVVEHFMEKGNETGSASTATGGDSMMEMMSDQEDIVYSDEEDVEFSDEDDINRVTGSVHSSERNMNNADLSDNLSMGARQSTLVTGGIPEDPLAGETTILHAAMLGEIELLKQHILSGNVNEVDENGQTALHMAADKGNNECVKILLEAGAHPNAADKEGINVLEAAVIGGSVAVVKLLLDAGADPDQKDVDGDTPRNCAEDDENPEMRQLLKSAKPVHPTV